MRNVTRHQVDGNSNSLWQVYKTVSFWKVMKSFTIITIARFTPWLSIKNWLYRTFLHMEIGRKTAIGLMVMMDTMFPERIHIGENTIIGYNSTILAHEYMIDEYRLGDVYIGSNVMIGAKVIILPGVTVGDNTIIGAGSVVTKDIPSNTFFAGNPAKFIKSLS